ncbi:MAG: Maf family protein, partial [Burkholderiales bacterium]
MTLWLGAQPLVLASRSKVRRAVLEAVAIPVEVVPADIDERAIAGGASLAPKEQAGLLAKEKALATARTRRERIVLGADQTLAFGK